MTDTLPAPPYPMDLIAELTPYTLTNDEAQAARTAFNWALRTRFTDMHAAMCDLPAPALRDVLLAVDVLGSTLRFELAGREFDRSLTPQEQSDARDQGSLMVVDVQPSYSLAHGRVRIDRGRAALQSCVDCDGPARSWSLAHERVGDRLMRDPRPYSMDPADYDPRCARCHSRYDIAHGKVVGKRWVASWSRSRRAKAAAETSFDGSDRSPVPVGVEGWSINGRSE